MKKRAVTILLHNEDGDILGVSRKNDPNDVGLPGGKCDDGETDEEAITREVKEETGLDVFNLKPFFTDEERDEFICTTFIGNYVGEIVTTEKGVVKWTDWETIQKGSFGDYNIQLEKFLNSNLKYSSGDIVVNPATSEAFLILEQVNYDPLAIPGYFVSAFTSNIGYAFVKKTAIDNVRMHVPSESSILSSKSYQVIKNIDVTSPQFITCAAHFDVNQYYGKNDSLFYSYHLRKVVDVGNKFKSEIPEEDWEYVEAGLWAHDAIEDARKTYNDMKASIGEKAADISFALANSTGKTRDERADSIYYDKIKNTKYATFCKLCDRIANVEYSLKSKSSMTDKYQKEYRLFKQKLYVEGEYESVWNYLESLIFKNGN